MKLYLIRHGQTESNLARTHNTEQEPLSQIGRQEAEVLAERFQSIPVDLVLASPLMRAQETAEVINNRVKKELVTLDILQERRWSTEMKSKPYTDPAIISLKQKMESLATTDPYARYSDEETFGEIRDRSQNFLEHLKTRPEQNILTVSHAQFLKILLAVMIHGPEVPFSTAWDVYKFTSLHNTGITVCEYHLDKWKLITLNDKYHLGEYSNNVEYPHLGEHRRQLAG